MQKLGQHFLRNPASLRKIAEAIHPKPKEIIIEIGPGHGELTRSLLQEEAALHLLVIEKDPRLAARLYDFLPETSVFDGDAVELLPKIIADRNLAHRGYKIIGNVPYYITGRLFRTLGDLPQKPAEAVFLIQKEVAERVTSTTPYMNRLAASVQLWAEATLLFSVPRSAFSPIPKVDAAVIRLVSRTKPLVDAHAADRILPALFAQPRKTIVNNLRTYVDSISIIREFLEDHHLSPNARPQDLTPEYVADLAKLIKQTV